MLSGRFHLEQMPSLRMDPQLIRSLRIIADERGTTVSELLREAATAIVSRSKVRNHVAIREIRTGSVDLPSHPRSGATPTWLEWPTAQHVGFAGGRQLVAA